MLCDNAVHAGYLFYCPHSWLLTLISPANPTHPSTHAPIDAQITHSVWLPISMSISWICHLEILSDQEIWTLIPESLSKNYLIIPTILCSHLYGAFSDLHFFIYPPYNFSTHNPLISNLLLSISPSLDCSV